MGKKDIENIELYRLSCEFNSTIDEENNKNVIGISFGIAINDSVKDICKALGKEKELEEFQGEIEEAFKKVGRELADISCSFANDVLLNGNEKDVMKLEKMLMKKILKKLEKIENTIDSIEEESNKEILN